MVFVFGLLLIALGVLGWVRHEAKPITLMLVLIFGAVALVTGWKDVS